MYRITNTSRWVTTSSFGACPFVGFCLCVMPPSLPLPSPPFPSLSYSSFPLIWCFITEKFTTIAIWLLKLPLYALRLLFIVGIPLPSCYFTPTGSAAAARHQNCDNWYHYNNTLRYWTSVWLCFDVMLTFFVKDLLLEYHSRLPLFLYGPFCPSVLFCKDFSVSGRLRVSMFVCFYQFWIAFASLSRISSLLVCYCVKPEVRLCRVSGFYLIL